MENRTMAELPAVTLNELEQYILQLVVSLSKSRDEEFYESEANDHIAKIFSVEPKRDIVLKTLNNIYKIVTDLKTKMFLQEHQDSAGCEISETHPPSTEQGVQTSFDTTPSSLSSLSDPSPIVSTDVSSSVSMNEIKNVRSLLSYSIVDELSGRAIGGLNLKTDKKRVTFLPDLSNKLMKYSIQHESKDLESVVVNSEPIPGPSSHQPSTSSCIKNSAQRCYETCDYFTKSDVDVSYSSKKLMKHSVHIESTDLESVVVNSEPIPGPSSYQSSTSSCINNSTQSCYETCDYFTKSDVDVSYSSQDIFYSFNSSFDFEDLISNHENDDSVRIEHEISSFADCVQELGLSKTLGIEDSKDISVSQINIQNNAENCDESNVKDAADTSSTISLTETIHRETAI